MHAILTKKEVGMNESTSAEIYRDLKKVIKKTFLILLCLFLLFPIFIGLYYGNDFYQKNKK